MKKIMSWEDCRGHIKLVERDIEAIKSIILITEERLKGLEEMKITENSCSVIVVDFYEAIKSLLIALMLSNGLKADNHECLIAFVKKNYPDLGFEADKIHELKEVRNRISYDGYKAKKDYLDRNLLEFKNIAREIKTRITF